MNRKEAAELLPIIQAYAEGKTIQTKNGNGWIDIDGDYDGLNLDSLIGYQDCFRIKPEATYRPFANAEECWNEMLKHQSFGYVYFADDNLYHNIIMLAPEQGCHEAYIRIGNCTVRGLEECFRIFTFADGLPFGVKVEED